MKDFFFYSPPTPVTPAGPQPEPIHRKVMAIIFNPHVPSQGGKLLTDAVSWNNPTNLIPTYLSDLQDCSYGYVNFEVAEIHEVDRLPTKEDGFSYDPDQFVNSLHSKSGFHQPDAVDYYAILEEFDVLSKVNEHIIDEVWLFGPPYAGFYESRMAGPDAFWCNAPPIDGTDDAGRRFVIMGFNYERGVGEMLEDMGHRAESILQHTFRNLHGDDNLWERFCRYDKTHPGQAEVGIVHYAPNSQIDYDWGNLTRVLSRCNNWYAFPDLSGDPIEVDCREWGNGDIRLHHLWWFRHFPHYTGEANGVSYNWWQYLIDPDTVP